MTRSWSSPVFPASFAPGSADLSLRVEAAPALAEGMQLSKKAVREGILSGAAYVGSFFLKF
jgi:hypothetical protein